jgi:endonuclease/exonuclease/phosphatase family metal-dependent hydrolase
MAALDRILIFVDCDAKYPLARVKMLPKGASDHNPLVVEIGGGGSGVYC